MAMTLDENAPEIEIGNLVNDILLAHKSKWDGDDEIQDMVAEAFVRGIKWERERNDNSNGNANTNGR